MSRILLLLLCSVGLVACSNTQEQLERVSRIPDSAEQVIDIKAQASDLDADFVDVGTSRIERYESEILAPVSASTYSAPVTPYVQPSYQAPAAAGSGGYKSYKANKNVEVFSLD